jgi:ABC-type amino acid transport substrate-binding protein
MKTTILTSIATAAVTVLVMMSALPQQAAPGVTAAVNGNVAYERIMKTGVLRCGYYPWPPYYLVDPNTQQVSGMGYDVAEKLGKLLDLKIEYVPMSMMGMQVEDLRRGLYDASCFDSWVIFTATKLIDYSNPYFYAPMFAYVREDNKTLTRLDQLNDPNVRFVGLDGDLSVGLTIHRFPDAALQTLPANTEASALMTYVATRKADVALIDPGMVATYNANNDVKLRALMPTVASYPVTFAVLKGEQKLLEMLNNGVAALVNTGMADEIIKKYDPQGALIYPVMPGYQVTKDP